MSSSAVMTANDSIQSHRKVTIGTERNFGIVFTIVLVVVGLGPLYHGGAVRWWAISLGGAFLVCAFVAPRLLRPLNQLWFRFGLMLHQVVNPIVMGALFLVPLFRWAWSCVPWARICLI